MYRFPPRLRQSTQTLSQRLLREGNPLFLSPKEMQSPSLKALQQWCENHGIGHPLLATGGWRFDFTTLNHIKAVLHALKLRPLEVAPASTRIERMAQGNEENKKLGERPFQYKLLASLATTIKTPFLGVPAQQRYPLLMDYRQLTLEAFSGVLVVENSEVFFQLGQAQWPLPASLNDFLLVYRGNDHSHNVVKAFLHHWRQHTHKPCAWFGDADIAGFCLGLKFPYTHFLLPKQEAFETAANRTQFEPKQLSQLAALAKAPANLQPYVHLFREQKALLQEAMVPMPLVLISLK